MTHPRIEPLVPVIYTSRLLSVLGRAYAGAHGDGFWGVTAITLPAFFRWFWSPADRRPVEGDAPATRANVALALTIIRYGEEADVGTVRVYLEHGRRRTARFIPLAQLAAFVNDALSRYGGVAVLGDDLAPDTDADYDRLTTCIWHRVMPAARASWQNTIAEEVTRIESFKRRLSELLDDADEALVQHGPSRKRVRLEGETTD